MSINHSIKSRLPFYAFIGVVSTVIHFLVASGYIRFVQNDILISNSIGFLVAYLFSYYMQSKIVFQSAISVNKAIKYFLVQFCALMLAVFASSHMLLNNAYLQTLIVAVLLVLISFVTHKFWTFNTKE